MTKASRLTDVNGGLYANPETNRPGHGAYTGDERKLYVFLVTATAEAGDGRRACVRMNAEVCEPVEFLN